MNLDESIIKSWEEHAFYESGLCSDGCVEKFGDFEFSALEKYGRILLKFQESYFKDKDNYFKEFDGESFVLADNEQNLDLKLTMPRTTSMTEEEW